MKFFLVPSAVGQASDKQFLSSYIVNDVLAIDAGSIGFLPDYELQASIQHVLITHSHMDHIASLASLLDNVWTPDTPPVTIHCTAEVGRALAEHCFNDLIWPNVFELPSPEAPFAKLDLFTPGQAIEIAGLRILPVSVNHVVPTVGFIVQQENSTVVFGSDSGPTDEIWHRANKIGNVKAVVMESAFPNEAQGRANVSKHLTPRLLASEIGKLDNSPRILVAHLKPSFRDRIVEQLMELEIDEIEICVPGHVYEC